MKNFSRRFFALSFVGIMTGLLGTLFTNCAPATFESIDLTSLNGEDPLLKYAWYFGNTGQKVFATQPGIAGNDLNLQQTWSLGFYGLGVKVLVSDDGLEDTHEDLNGSFLYGNKSKNYRLASPWVSNTASPGGSEDNHGTAVAGLIAAVGGNGVGSRGVAPRAQVAIANFLGTGVTQNTANLIDQATGDFDVFNMSWGGWQNTVSAPDTTFESQLKYGVTNGRSGKGSIYTKAAGNEFVTDCRGSTNDCVGNSNFDADNTNPYVIVTGALNARGAAASYSSFGSNLWISSFGGEYGTDSPAMVTTDRTGCSNGYSKTGASASAFERGVSENASCKYTATFNGTSSATPVLSGVIALLLEANPQLTWRDVKYILAKTAKKVHTGAVNIPHPLAVASPTGYVWEPGWFMNQAGFNFNNWYGFGQVDVDAAVTMARSYTSSFGPFTTTNWANTATGLNVAIPDFSATGSLATTMTVSSTMKIEAVQLKLSVTHDNIAQLAVELTSPSGTKSVLVNMNNALVGIHNYAGEVFLTNAFYQEPANGTWTLKVYDGAMGVTNGVITGWSLNFFGSN